MTAPFQLKWPLAAVWAGSFCLLLAQAFAVPTSAQLPTPGDPEVTWAGAPRLADWARGYLQGLDSLPLTVGDDWERSMERVRAMYFLSVEKKEWGERAADTLGVLETRIPVHGDVDAILQAYGGALEVVRAKHSRWPPNKLKYLNRGAAILDGLVDGNPGNLEIRYLRLASYWFLPGFLRRDGSVEADLKVLVADLPDQTQAFSPVVYRGVVRFLLENGDLVDADRERLTQALNGFPGQDSDGRVPHLSLSSEG